MTIARVHLVDPLVSRWYHCITRCVRRAQLLGEKEDRKDWIEHRLKELAEIFGVSVGGFAVLDNHLHLLVRLDPETVKNWSDEEVIRRWARLFPPRDKMRRPLDVSDDWVAGHLLNTAWIERARARLASLSWFMKCLKESRRRGWRTSRIRPVARSSRGGSRALPSWMKNRCWPRVRTST